MKLSNAASYFSRTAISGWNGTGWDEDLTVVTFLPFDRFISEREFGTKRRYVLVPKNDKTLDNYSVIRFDNEDEKFLVGVRNFDIKGTEYSKAYMLHRAVTFVDVIGFTKTYAASGTARKVERQQLNSYWADIERVTYNRSKEFNTVKFSEEKILLPREAVVETSHEIVNGSEYFDIQESYMAAGLRECRAIRKKSA